MEDYSLNIFTNNKLIYDFNINNPDVSIEKILCLGIKVYSSLEENNRENYTKDDLLEIIKLGNDDIAEKVMQRVGDRIKYDTREMCNSMIQTNNQTIERVNERNHQLFQPVIEHFSSIRENSSKKGQYSENHLELILNNMFPSAEITNTCNIPQCCDIKLDRKGEKEIILFENKEYSKNIPKDEVDKFIRDIELNKQHGIFLSQKSGITTKTNLQCDIRNSKLLIYLHNVNYSPEIIQLAVDCIDTFSSFLKQNNLDLRENVITNEDLQEINLELNSFITLKQNMIENLNNFHRKMQIDLTNLMLPSLKKLIDKRFGTQTNDNKSLICNICNKFTAKTQAGLSRHKKSCKGK
jgi:hypothetical protein